MKLTNRQKYDYRDIDRMELKLIRVGHAIWALWRREKRLKSHTVREEQAFEASIETMVRLKKEYRAELKVKLAAKSAATLEYFRGKHVA